jgi:uncharacterized protein (TIGR00251 family)
MIINLKVVANAKKNEIKEENGLFKVYVAAPPVDGKANKAVVETLAAHFQAKKNQIKIIRGEKSSRKVVQIDDGAGNFRPVILRSKTTKDLGDPSPALRDQGDTSSNTKNFPKRLIR